MHVDRDEYDISSSVPVLVGRLAAYRLAQKGYRVLVLEKGRRYRTQDFPKTNWNLKKSIGCRNWIVRHSGINPVAACDGFARNGSRRR